MKIVIAPDSFKGSASARQVSEAIERGLKNALREEATVLCCPIADGGEGTLDALVNRADRIAAEVAGPLFAPVAAEYGCVGDTAVIEMASAAGLTLVPESERRAGKATTHGVGELIANALNKGYRKIMLTVGGSATNDGGCGMFSALGAVYRNSKGEAFLPTGETLSEIASLELSGVLPALWECEITIATDVKNPLLGATGATMVYGAQKGATQEELEAMERGMERYAALVERMAGAPIAALAGCGAGGGVALPLLAFAGARIKSGIETVLEVNRFRERVSGADLVITGEGRLDGQSLYGKAISGVADVARELGVPVICLVGCVGELPQDLTAMGIRKVLTVASLASSTEDSMKNAERYLEQLAMQVAEQL